MEGWRRHRLKCTSGMCGWNKCRDQDLWSAFSLFCLCLLFLPFGHDLLKVPYQVISSYTVGRGIWIIFLCQSWKVYLSQCLLWMGGESSTRYYQLDNWLCQSLSSDWTQHSRWLWAWPYAHWSSTDCWHKYRSATWGTGTVNQFVNGGHKDDNAAVTFFCIAH